MSTHVVISDDRKNYPDVFERVLADRDVTLSERDMQSEDAIVAASEDADVVVTNSRAPVTADVVRELGHLDAITQTSIGVDNVAVRTAAELGVPVVRAPDYCRDEVATHALTLLLACLRKAPTYDDAVRGGEWSALDTGRPIHRLAGRTVGLVAFGPIARRFARRLDGFDCEVLAYDPYVDAETMAERGVEKVSFRALFERSAHVSCHAPITDETRGMVGEEAFSLLDETAVVVNTGRGGVVDEAALEAALEGGEVAAAALDVFDEEPPWGSPLLERDDVLVTPHAAWYSEESIVEANESVAADVARLIDGEEPAGLVDPDDQWL